MTTKIVKKKVIVCWRFICLATQFFILLANKEVTENTTDVYAYLNSGEFSSENFKIEIQNLPKYYGINVPILTLV